MIKNSSEKNESERHFIFHFHDFASRKYRNIYISVFVCTPFLGSSPTLGRSSSFFSMFLSRPLPLPPVPRFYFILLHSSKKNNFSTSQHFGRKMPLPFGLLYFSVYIFSLLSSIFPQQFLFLTFTFDYSYFLFFLLIAPELSRTPREPLLSPETPREGFEQRTVGECKALKYRCM